MNLIARNVLRTAAVWAAVLAALGGAASAQVTNLAGPIGLSWTPSATVAAASYVLYRGVEPGVYMTRVNVGALPRATVSDLTLGTTWYFAVTAIDADGYESPFSNEISYTPSNGDALPVWAPVADQTIDEDTATPAIALAIPDLGGNPADTVLTAYSTDARLVPAQGIALGGSGSSRTLTLTPGRDQSGVAQVVVVARNGSVWATNSVTLRVLPVNDAPAGLGLSNQLFYADGSSTVLPMELADVDTSLASLVVTVASDNPALFPPASLAPEGSGGSRTLRLTPAAGQTGAAWVTVVVSDGAASTTSRFHAGVLPGSLGGVLAPRYPGQGLKLRLAALAGNAGSVPAVSLVSVDSASAQGGEIAQRGGWVFYTPPPGLDDAAAQQPASGALSDAFGYMVMDAFGAVASGQVTVYVNTLWEGTQSLALESGASQSLIFSGIPGRTYTLQYLQDGGNPGSPASASATADPVGVYEYLDPAGLLQAALLYRASAVR